MAKKSAVQKSFKKEKMVAQTTEKREALKEELIKAESFEEQMLIQKKINKLRLNSSKVRLKNRCWRTGRPRGFHRDLGVCRNVLREMAHRGEIPGLTKASW